MYSLPMGNVIHYYLTGYLNALEHKLVLCAYHPPQYLINFLENKYSLRGN